MSTVHQIAQEIVESGQEAEEHCGMVRCIVNTQLPWDDVARLAST